MPDIIGYSGQEQDGDYANLTLKEGSAMDLKDSKAKQLLPLHRIFNSFPGGLMIIPLFLGAIITTVSQSFGVADLWAELGDPMQTLFSSKGIIPFLGLMLFFTGTQTDVRKLKTMVKVGLPLIAIRFGLVYAFAFLALEVWGLAGFVGVSFVALLSCLASPNAVLFNGLTEPYGDDSDRSYFSISLMLALPVFPLLLLQGAEGASIDYRPILSLILPFAFGILLGNLDPALRSFFERGNSVIIMFLGFQFGSYINLVSAAKEIPSALLLTLVFYGVAIMPSLLFEKFVVKRSGYVTLAMSGVAGVSLSIPELAAAALPSTAAYMETAIYQLAFALIFTCVLAPWLVDGANRLELKTRPQTMKANTPRLFAYTVKREGDKELQKEKRYVKRSLKFLFGNLADLALSLGEKTFLESYSDCLYEKRIWKLKRARKAMADEVYRVNYGEIKAARAQAGKDLAKLSAKVLEARKAAARKAFACPDDKMRREFSANPLLDPYRRRCNRRLRFSKQPLPPLPKLAKGELSLRCLKVYLVFAESPKEM